MAQRVIRKGAGRLWEQNINDNFTELFDRTHVSVMEFGAVADGADSGSAFSGTDNTAAFQAALDAASDVGAVLTIPPGVYYFSATTAGIAYETQLTAPTFVHIEAHGATLLIDDDVTATGTTPRYWMRAATYDSEVAPGSLYDLFKWTGGTLRGRWSHQGVTGTSDLGENFINIVGYARVEFDGVEMTDCRGKMIGGGAHGDGYVRNCTFRRSVSDVCRFVNTPNFAVDDNHFEHTSDDAVALHSRDNAASITPTRSGLSCSRNTFLDCESIHILGPHGTIVSGNKVFRSRGSGLTVGAQSAPEGSTAQTAVLVHDNFIMDSLQAYTASGGFGTASNQNASVIIGGAAVVGAIGEYDGVSAVNDPRGDGTDAGPTWGGDWYDEGSDASLTDSAGSRGISFRGNTIMRTLPAVTNYSDWGFGQMFNRTGWVDPAVTDSDFRSALLSIWSDVQGCSVTGNHFEGVRDGYCIWLFLTGNNVDHESAFRNVRIGENTFVDFFKAISSSRQGASPPSVADITVQNNVFDGDPYHVQSTRTTPIDGSWSSTADGSACCSINMTGWEGWKVSGNTHRNVYTPIIPSNIANQDNYGDIFNELVECDPAATTYSASNKGVGYVQPSGPAYRYMIVDSDPTSATWRALINGCQPQAGAIPSSGTWVQGHFVWKQNPTVASGKVLLGWSRLTTGGNNVSGTDWSPVYGTTT